MNFMQFFLHVPLQNSQRVITLRRSLLSKYYIILSVKDAEVQLFPDVKPLSPYRFQAQGNPFQIVFLLYLTSPLHSHRKK